jgi:hypothetical protein
MSKFVGDETAVHIHTEGSSYHYKNSKLGNGSRRNFNINKQNEINAAYQNFLLEGWEKESGYNQCLKYFTKNLNAQ